MRQIISVPTIHSPYVIRRTATFTNPSNIEPSVARSTRFSDKLWSIVGNRLAQLPPGKNYRVYLEGYTGSPLKIEPGQTNTPIDTESRHQKQKLFLIT